MSGGLISANYRELETETEIQQAAVDCAQAWQDPEIPARQYELAVKGEMASYRQGTLSDPFRALLSVLQALPKPFIDSWPRLLDIGASAGYYSEVLKVAGYDFRYTGLDFSPAFVRFAEMLYPSIDFDLGDARQLSYHDDWFGIVLTGGCLMHVREYEKVISEAARVARNYVIFHRTPVYSERPTTYFLKEAYGVPCLEIHFSERELLALFQACGLTLVETATVFWTSEEHFGHRTYLLEKKPGLNHIAV